MALAPLPVRPVLAAAASLLICTVFATMAATREGISTALRTGWWVVAALWLVVGCYYARKAARGPGRHAGVDQAEPASSAAEEPPGTGWRPTTSPDGVSGSVPSDGTAAGPRPSSM